MMNPLPAALLLLAALPAAASAQADQESFAAYPPGLLAGNGDWTGEEKPGAVQVQPGQLKLEGYRAATKGRIFLPATRSKVHEAAWRLPQERRDFFFSFLMRIDKSEELPTERVFNLFRMAKDGTGPAAAGLYLQKDATTGQAFLVGSKRANPEKTSKLDVPLPLGEVALVVGHYNNTTVPHSLDLWLNPHAKSHDGEPPKPDLTLDEGADLPAAVNTVILGGGVGSPGILLDEIRVGNTWTEVIGP